MGKGIVPGLFVVAMLLTVMISPAMARTDDCIFYFLPDEISVAPGEEVTIYLNLDAPVNATSTFVADVIFDPGVVECLGVTENTSVTNWMAWTFWGIYPTNDGRESIYFDSLDFYGQGPGQLRCGDIVLRGVSPGVTTMYVGWSEVPDPNNRSLVGDMAGDPKDWTTETITFTCVGEAETFEKDLVSGWNLVSLPLTPDDNSTSAVLGSITYDSVKNYNAATNQFEDATTMDPGIGYFVHMTDAGTWIYEGDAYVEMTADLSQGLNCVGWVNETGSALPGALDSIAGDYRYVARWNAGTQSYEVYVPGVSSEFSDFSTMDRGLGYFISATDSCTLAYP